jgi:serine protease Do
MTLAISAVALAVAGGISLGQMILPGNAPRGTAATRPAAAPEEKNETPPPPPFSTEARSDITRLPPGPLMPKTAEDLRAIQARVEAVVRQSLPAVVGIQMSDGQGSGVIVSKDGYVLTAGHVSGKPGTPVTIILSNGTRVEGKSMGANNGIDSGMVKITRAADYPFVPVGTAARLVPGQWAVALGHPGGYQRQRPPVLRLGRILSVSRNRSGITAVATDCPLINGDSGGPVFDLDGRVIGINSRIGISLTQNVHVPIDTFLETWDRLAAGEQWGGGFFARRGFRGREGPEPLPSGALSGTPALGIKVDENSRGPVVTLVFAGTGAEGAGMKEGDIVIKMDNELVKTKDELAAMVLRHKPGDVVVLDVLRNESSRRLRVTLGERTD